MFEINRPQAQGVKKCDLPQGLRIEATVMDPSTLRTNCTQQLLQQPIHDDLLIPAFVILATRRVDHEDGIKAEAW